MDTTLFRTRQESRDIPLPKGKDYIVSADIGYSGTKVFCESGCFCFPSYAKRMDHEMMDLPDEKDIFYRNDETGKVYLVGYNAQNMADDANDTKDELYTRRRYTDERFRVLCQVAVGLAIMNRKDDRKVVVQTGLPASYIRDAADLKKAFCNMPRFSLRAGTDRNWVSFAPQIGEGDVYVMEQPKGALYSAIIHNNGMFTRDAMGMLKGSVMVMDAGFLTFDFYGIRDRRVECHESLDNIGMYQVFLRTTQKIQEAFGEEVRVPALQKNLTTGKITCVDVEAMVSMEKEFGMLLGEANDEVFLEAKEKIRRLMNDFRGYDYAIVGGGTGEAWYGKICDWLKGITTLHILPGNVNDSLPFIYSNARGYYMYRYSQDRR